MSLYLTDMVFRLNIGSGIALCIAACMTTFLIHKIFLFKNRSSIATEDQCQNVTSFQEPVSFWTSAAHGFIGALFKPLRHMHARGDALDDIIFPRFLKYGYTHRVNDWGFDRLWTADPENIQVLLKGNFAH